MTDMTSVIVPKSDQINADDLISGNMTITITDVKVVGGQEQPVSIHFAGSPKVFRPCKSMSRVLVAVWGPDAKKYVGRSLTLYRDPTVKWGGMEVGGIRIKAMTDMEGNRPVTMALTATKGARKPYTVAPLKLDAASSEADPAILDEARTEARKGTDAFRSWWAVNVEKRAVAKSIMGELQTLASKADLATATDDDPFGLPPIGTANTSTETDAEVEAKAMADARAYADEQARLAGAA